MAVPHHARHTGQPGRVPVLLVNLQPVLFADFIQIIHALPVFLVAPGIHPHDGVQALFPGEHQAGHRKLHFPDNRVLLFQVRGVRFYQGVTVFGHVLIFASIPVQRVEADPRTGCRIVISQYSADVPAAVVQLFNKLPRSPVPAPLLRKPSCSLFIGFLPACRYISHVLPCFKQGFQIFDELGGRIPFLRFPDLLPFDPVLVHNDAAFIRNGIVPVQFPAAGLRLPSLVLRQLDDRAAGYRGRGAMEAAPFAVAFPGMIAGGVPAAPGIPVSRHAAFFLQGHAHIYPVLVIQKGRVDMLQYFQNVIAFHTYTSSGT